LERSSKKLWLNKMGEFRFRPDTAWTGDARNLFGCLPAGFLVLDAMLGVIERLWDSDAIPLAVLDRPLHDSAQWLAFSVLGVEEFPYPADRMQPQRRDADGIPSFFENLPVFVVQGSSGSSRVFRVACLCFCFSSASACTSASGGSSSRVTL